MESLNYEEIDLLWEVLNFKIISKNSIYQNYKIFNGIKDKNRKLNDIIKKLNKILIQAGVPPSIEKSKEYIYYNSKPEYRKIDYKNKFIYKDLIRREMIEILLILNRRKFRIDRFIKGIGKEKDNDRKHIKNDLKLILCNYNISYKEYMESANSTVLLGQKIKDLYGEQHRILKNILIRRWEKVYENRSTIVETKIINFISEELGIKNMSHVYDVYLEFLKEYRAELCKNNEYELFTYLVLGLNNKNINTSKRIKKNTLSLKNDREYELIDKMLKQISKYEKIKIYTNFKIKLYKMLLKIEKTEGRSKENKEVSYEEDNYVSKRRIIYRIAEEGIEETGKKYETVRKNLIMPNGKINILLVLDMENQKYMEYREEIKSLFLIFNIVNIMSMKELKKELDKIPHNNLNYSYILLISDILLQNIIENKIGKPIYFIKLTERSRNKIQNRKEFLNQIIESNNLIQNYYKVKNL